MSRSLDVVRVAIQISPGIHRSIEHVEEILVFGQTMQRKREEESGREGEEEVITYHCGT
jgi:hypothetical protein